MSDLEYITWLRATLGLPFLTTTWHNFPYPLRHLFCRLKNDARTGTCAELQQAVDLTTSSGDTDAVLTSAGIACDEWTTFEVMNNRLKLVAKDGGSFAGDQVYAFENVRFLVSSGVLRADVALSLTTGADDQRQVCGIYVLGVVVGLVVTVGVSVRVVVGGGAGVGAKVALGVGFVLEVLLSLRGVCVIEGHSGAIGRLVYLSQLTLLKMAGGFSKTSIVKILCTRVTRTRVSSTMRVCCATLPCGETPSGLRALVWRVSGLGIEARLSIAREVSNF